MKRKKAKKKRILELKQRKKERKKERNKEGKKERKKEIDQ